MTTTHVALTELPSAIRAALEAVGYHRADVGVSPAETYCLAGMSGDGYRRFVCAVNLATGERQTHYGSWGGSNPWATDAPAAVNGDTTLRPIPPGFAIITGCEGGGHPVSASIAVSPATLAPLLPAGAAVTEREQKILAIVGGLKSGPYRREAMERLGVTAAEMDSLVERKLLSRNKAGAVSITTAGKNARGDTRAY